jgi:peptidyl-prolyl cis-trans isomerase B (cyclophilin B)
MGELRNRTFTEAEVAGLAKMRAVIDTKFGTVRVRFFPELAPNHVESFIELAGKGYFDGTLFHRVVPGFVIQGGDPNTKGDNTATYGTGGPGYNLVAEFSKTPHKKGILSMARSALPHSAGSQFFICVADVPYLDNQYTVFGEVESGIEAVDAIVAQPRNAQDMPNERIEMKVRIEG